MKLSRKVMQPRMFFLVSDKETEAPPEVCYKIRFTVGQTAVS